MLELGYTHTAVDFESPRLLDTPLAGGYAHQGSVSLERQLSPQFTLGAEYHLRQAVLEDADDRFNIHDATITAQYKLTPNMDLSGFAGVSHIGAGLQHREQTGPTVGITISRQLTRAGAHLGWLSAHLHSLMGIRRHIPEPGSVRHASRAVRAQSGICRGAGDAAQRRSAAVR